MGGGDKCLRALARQADPRPHHRAAEASGLRYCHQCQWRCRALCALRAFPSSLTAWLGLPGPLPESMRDSNGLRRTVLAPATSSPSPPIRLSFPPISWRRFLAELKTHPPLLVAASAEGVHPVIGLWPVALAPDLENALEQGMRKVGAFTKQQGAVEVLFPPVNVGGRLIDPFFNINRPEELAEAEHLVPGAISMTPPLFGVVGWKNSGKTTLMVALISELKRRGYDVSVIKHAHANFEIDHQGRDSFKMREAGACQVTLSSPRRFALMRELGDTPELSVRGDSSPMPVRAI